MPEQIKDPVAVYFQVGALLLSVTAGLALLVARSQGPWLKFKPRRLVPWNAVGALLASTFVFMILLSAILPVASPGDETASSGHASAAESAFQLVERIAAPAFIVGAVFVMIVVLFKPARHDLGLPASRRELAEDVALGLIVALAALAPVLLLQALLMSLLGIESGHDLVKLIRDGQPNPLVFALAALAAVFVAPVCEEITFRLLLQGWLEKRETQLVKSSTNEQPATNDDLPASGDHITALPGTVLSTPPPHGAFGWPFGWLPITVSSALFGLAHYGYGPEPIPLFLFAVMLGYVYQRTHRIVPCIVAHAAFNSFTMFLLWRMAFYGAE